MDTAIPKLNRRQWPAWSRWLGLVAAYVVFLPIVRVLEWTGRWPRLMSRGMARMMGDFEGYEPQAHDVLVCSYFKTGTNWTMQIAAQIAHRGRADFDHIHDLVPWLELPSNTRYCVSISDDRVWQNAPTKLRVIKTHLPFDRLTYTPAGRYIWVVRDPKDVFVSSYHFIRSTMLGPLMPSVQRWLDLYLSQDTFIGSWANHLQGGWERRDRDNVLFLSYEEMKANLDLTVKRIADFMGVDLTAEEMERVVQRSSYTHMKTIGHKFDTFGLSPPWAAPRGAMVRRGQRGAAGELLSQSDQRRIDDYWRAELEGLGSDFAYDAAFADPPEPLPR